MKVKKKCKFYLDTGYNNVRIYVNSVWKETDKMKLADVQGDGS